MKIMLKKIIIAFLVVSFCLSQMGCFLQKVPVINEQLERAEKAKQAEIDSAISKNAELRSLAATCSTLGSLKSFKLIGRDIYSHGKAGLSYYYASEESYDDTYRTLSAYLSSNGWHSIESLSVNRTFAFQKDDMRVTVQYGGIGTADYGITCEMRSGGER